LNIEISDCPVSYAVAAGLNQSRHGVQLRKMARGWQASSGALCGARLILSAGRLAFASCGLEGITCWRCSAYLRDNGLGMTVADGIVVPSWR
jgi:hypothetical protein